MPGCMERKSRAITEMTPPRHIWFDLSELFFSWNPDFKYYGIARTVMEIGYELHLAQAGVRYAVFSPGHGRFFEVFPSFGEAARGGLIEIGFPGEATPRRLRLHYPTRNLLRDALLVPVAALNARANRQRWAHVPPERIRPADLRGGALISVGRYKIMSDYLAQLSAHGQGLDFAFWPMIHDMIPLHYRSGAYDEKGPENYLLDNSLILRNAAGIFANSDFTAQDLARFAQEGTLPTLPGIVTVPLVHEFRSIDEPVEIEPPSQPYLLCVGTQPGRKNLETVLEALRLVRAGGMEPPLLVLAGARHQRIVDLVEGAYGDVSDRVVYAENPNQAELSALYANAFGFVIASRIEGWGLPLGEALWHATPAFAADIPALRQVGGDLARFFPPRDAEALAAHIRELAEQPNARATWKTRLRAAHPHLRRWRDVAADMLTALRAPSSSPSPSQKDTA